METYDEVTYEILQKNLNNYIQLGGRGILDGLQCPSKYSIYLIVKILKGITPDRIEDGVCFRQYRRRKLSFLPEMNFNQQCRIYTPKEYKKLPIYFT